MGFELQIADGLSLPIEAVTQTFAILAKRGTGKTHAASVMAEEMLRVGQPIVVYDPTGAWYGLKSSKDGKRPGYPVVVFGGEHADVPLEETAGATVASVIVEKRFPAILDCGLMRKGARIRFMTDFCETLYHKNRDALHFFVDEAQTIAPQNLKAMPEAARLLGAMEDIVMQGRRRGLGLTIISPRPAVVNTNLRSACEVIVAMQIIGPHDRKAISEWIDTHGDDESKAKEMMASLSSLKRGEAWVWSPGWLHQFKRVTFRDRETFDSSATPEVGRRAVIPKVIAEVDLDALGEQIKATVEKAKADDPKELKRQLAELKRQLQVQKPAAPTIERIEVPVLKNGQLEAAHGLVDRMREMGQQLLDRADTLRQTIGAAVRHPAATAAKPPSAARPAPPPKSQRPAPATRAASAGPGEALPKGERRILVAAAQYADGAGRETLTVLTGYKRSSRDTYLQRLRERGFVDQAGDRIVATEAGVTALGADFEPLPTGEALREHWMSRLPEGERRILEVLIGRYPDAVDRDDLDESTGYKRSSRDTYLQRLSARQLVESVGRGSVRASSNLFGE
jgi:hypothetical protein